MGMTPMTVPGGVGHSCVHALHRVCATVLESQISVSRNQDGAGCGEWQGLCLVAARGAEKALWAGGHKPLDGSCRARCEAAPRCQE